MGHGYKTTDEAWRQWAEKDVKAFKLAMFQLPDQTYRAFSASSSQIPNGSVRVFPQPRYPAHKDPREGTKQAMEKLEANHKPLIAWACHLAVKMAREKLTVHSRMVRDAMEAMNLLEPGASEFWLGAAFQRLAKQRVLERSGHTYKYSDSTRGIHERTITIWQLVDGADTEFYDIAPNEVLPAKG